MPQFANPLSSSITTNPYIASQTDQDWVVLEIGTFIGFSTLGWLEAVGVDGHVTALEFSPEYAAIAEETFTKNGIKNAEVMVGDARES
jgi:predicted O-methyltransferase YrrM